MHISFYNIFSYILHEMREILDKRLSAEDIRTLSTTYSDKKGIRLLLSLMHDDNERIASNAAWILTHTKNKKIFNEYQNELIDITLNSKNETLQRLSLNMLEHQDYSIKTMRSDFVDYCLSQPLNVNVKPGIVNLCIKIGYKICKPVPELLHEYIEVINMMRIEHYATSVKTIRKKILNQYRQDNNQ